MVPEYRENVSQAVGLHDVLQLIEGIIPDLLVTASVGRNGNIHELEKDNEIPIRFLRAGYRHDLFSR
jgi:hypothetical protein